MSDLREQKQQYLRQSILQKNYDAEEFMEYCETIKGSIDIDSWTFDELVDIVKKFIKSQNEKLQPKFQSPFFTQGFSANSIDPNLSNQFNNWSEFYQPPQPAPKGLELSLLDLEFLEGFTSPRSNDQKKSPTKQDNNINKNMMMIPNDIANKLQQGNNDFIVGYKNTIENTDKQVKYNSMKDIQAKQERAKLPSINSQNTYSQSFQAEVETRKITSKTKFIGNQQVVVSGHQIINPNVFVPNYILYTLTINPLNIQVKRKLKDFQTLRNTLKKLFPTTQIPYLQRFGRLSETQPTIIKKQKLFIESFLNNLLMNQNIRCKLLQDFLTLQDNDLLKKVFKDYQKFQKPKAIEALFTQTGKIKLKLNSTNKKYIDQQSFYLDYLQTNQTKLKNLYDQLINGLLQNAKILTQINQTYQALKDSTKTINQTFPEDYRSLGLQKTFDSISQLHKQWILSFKTQAKILESEIRHQCRFQCNNTQTIKQILKMNQSIVTDSYQRRGDQNQSNKDSYDSKKLIEYKNGVDYPSKNITVLKYQAAYIQQQTVQEIKRYLKEFSLKFNHKFNLFSMLQLNINNDMDNTWKDFQKHTLIGQKN